MIHSTCIQHYKRGLLACTMERVERLKHIHWNRNDYSTDIAGNLAPLEVEFLLQYEQILKKFADACGLATDLSMDATPPKSKCVQVRLPIQCLIESSIYDLLLRPMQTCRCRGSRNSQLPLTALIPVSG